MEFMKEKGLPYIEVRRRIANIEDLKNRMFVEAVYLLGVARPTELASKRESGVKKPYVFGPRGYDATIEQICVPPPDTKELLELLTKIESKKITISTVKEMFSRKLDVALFKIKLSKRALENDEHPYRIIGLPINNEFEDPWTRELYDYFKKAGDSYVFIDYSRQQAQSHINSEGTFKDIKYNVEDYVRTRHTISGTTTEPIEEHPKQLFLEGLSILRHEELENEYGFDDLDWAAYTGSLVRVTRNDFTTQVNWHRYIKKLCRRPPFVPSPRINEF
jgi:hypothetical protein